MRMNDRGVFVIMLGSFGRFDAFLDRFNRERPHQALGMKVPADLYTRSPRVYRGLEDLTYPFHDQTIAVTRCGRICFKGRKVNLSHVFAGQDVGVTQDGERIWLVTFMHYDLGYFDDETCRLEPIDNPFGPKVLRHQPARRLWSRLLARGIRVPITRRRKPRMSMNAT